jgi:hypothetical protein
VLPVTKWREDIAYVVGRQGLFSLTPRVAS